MVCKDGSSYYSYLVIYVDDVLYIDEDPREFIKQIDSTYRVKSESIVVPDSYHGMNACTWEVQSSGGDTVKTRSG